MQVRQVPPRQALGGRRPASSAAASSGRFESATKPGPPGSKRTVKRREGASSEGRGARPLSVMANHNQQSENPNRSMSSYQVRPAVSADAEQVAVVHASSSQAAYASVAPEAHQNLPLDKRRALWREAIEFGEPLVQVVLEAGRVIGFAGFDRSRDPKSRPTTGEIWAFYVLPSHWGRGVG